MSGEPASGVAVQFLTGTDDIDIFDSLYDEVLTPSFRPSELIDADQLLRAVRGGRSFVAVAVAPDRTAVGGVIADWYDDSRVLLVSYLAVRPGRRGQGVGQALIGATAPVWSDQLAPLVTLGEVEDPRYFPGIEYGDAVARLRLYARHGARLLPVPYLQPEIRPGHGRVPHLLLLAFAVDAAACPAPGRVDGAIIDRFLDRYFTEAEGPARDGDADLARLRDACRQPGGLPLLEVPLNPGPPNSVKPGE